MHAASKGPFGQSGFGGKVSMVKTLIGKNGYTHTHSLTIHPLGFNQTQPMEAAIVDVPFILSSEGTVAVWGNSCPKNDEKKMMKEDLKTFDSLNQQKEEATFAQLGKKKRLTSVIHLQRIPTVTCFTLTFHSEKFGRCFLIQLILPGKSCRGWI